jgi:hypothetical protein
MYVYNLKKLNKMFRCKKKVHKFKGNIHGSQNNIHDFEKKSKKLARLAAQNILESRLVA